jgi:hypothetical protein
LAGREQLWSYGCGSAERSGLTPYGFGSTEATNHPREVAEAALARTVGDKTEAAYQRGGPMEQRRRLMSEWAAFCARPAATAELVVLCAGA